MPGLIELTARSRLKKTASGLLLLACTSLASASTLTLDQALQTAFASNPELAAAQWEIGIAEGDRKQAGLIPNPEVSWEAEDTRRESRTTTVMLSQPIELGGKRGARIDVASRAQDAAGIELERKRNVLRADVLQAFNGAQTAQQRLQLARQSLQLAEHGVRVAQGRIEAGKSSPVEGTRAQVQLSEVRLELSRAERDQANAYQQLAQVMGAPLPTSTTVQTATQSLPSVPPPTRLLERLNETAELRLARLQIDQREASLGLEKSQRIPDLTVSIGSQYSETERERVNVVGLSMPIPLFNRNQGNVLAAARRTDQARDLRNATELRLRTEIQTTLAQWQTANGEIQTFDRIILPAAQSAVDSATRGFEMGKFGFLDVLDAQRTLIAARSQYIQAVSEATDARVRIERIFGDLSANP
ncbi:TolC family protein [Pseudomonas fluorescens]|uniref:Putative metal transport-related exported protein n=1 Tax=Pseudomonas fluorescens (strain Pf0-1) TaxID=205922 RepID=Q3KA43_PSEPF|nr:TolC family protein [Pseudomonas fluorescens]ABA75361.1 putative metal transport-related exported protein [Pseudomonas fluorescens Pf0-1]MBY9025596.1 TolC family protein [Pseudomonas fluorescens]MBY9032174.1 TolC family protein [Pseudomonas fluorescens]MBY9037414.1 TolC family protein [Pseudomonas fluorescens]MBY9043798.1 TolC family protein [Pseudomonas fluorescens]